MKDIAETGADPKEVMDELNAIYEELDDVPEELRMTAALAKLAEQTENSDLAMVLFNTAMKKGTLELTQNMDAIES